MKKKMLLAVCSLSLIVIVFASAVLFQHGLRPPSVPTSLALSLNASANQSPYDTRACAFNPSSANCDGQLPVTTNGDPGVGSGACIDAHTVKYPQPFTQNGVQVGEFDLFWSPTCQSYFSFVAYTGVPNVTITVKTTQHSGITVYDPLDQATFEYFNQEETTGPVQQNEAWSPIKWSPDKGVSADATIMDGQGNLLITTETLTYVGGRVQM